MKKTKISSKENIIQIPKKGEYFIVKKNGIEGKILKTKSSGEITVFINGEEKVILNNNLWKQVDKQKGYYKESIIDDIQVSSVLENQKTLKNDLHPTMKPISLLEKILNNSSEEGDNILDLFGGSGSTLIACEKKARVCYMMELAPEYIQVIIKRFYDVTGGSVEIECLNRDIDFSFLTE